MCYNSASSSSAKAGHWQVSSQLLHGMSGPSAKFNLYKLRRHSAFFIYVGLLVGVSEDR